MSGQPLSSAQMSLGLRSHNNHYLFSDHYLNYYILKRDDRRQAAVQAGDDFLTWVSELYDRERQQLALGEGNALFASHTFVRDNILVQINGELDEATAAEDEAALNAAGE